MKNARVTRANFSFFRSGEREAFLPANSHTCDPE
jgi:hypothetical protein